MTANFGKNQGVANTLDAYLRLDKPRFAVLLQGKWGSGKTWFIRNYMEKRSNETQPFCYVSLFGVEQLKEIDSQIIASCNSTFSKAVGLSKLAGAIIERCNPVIKETDIEKIGEFLKKWCKIPENLVLVLDDLERASIPIELVLGYVSNLLDEIGIKVILLCDQGQISEKDEKIFSRFKEKVVGSTIAVVPDASTVLNSQVESICDDEIKKAFKNNKEAILNNFNNSKCDNLRHIKRLIFEFSICYAHMLPEMQQNESYLSEFLHMLFIFSLEINNKSLHRDQFTSKIEKICIYYRFPSRYESIDEVHHRHRSAPHLPTEFFEKFFYDGTIDEPSLNSSYSLSLHANSSKLPLLLYNKFNKMELSDSEARRLYDDLIHEINNFMYTDAEEILHAFDIMLEFSKIGIESRSHDDIIQLAKTYIESIEITNNSFEISKIKKATSFLTGNYPQFDQLCEYIYARISDITNKNMATFIQEATQHLPDNPDVFLKKLPMTPENHFILTSLDVDDLVSRLNSLYPPKLTKVMETIYYYLEIRENFPRDITWVNELCCALEGNLASRPTLEQNILQQFIDLFRQLIPHENLQQTS